MKTTTNTARPYLFHVEHNSAVMHPVTLVSADTPSAVLNEFLYKFCITPARINGKARITRQAPHSYRVVVLLVGKTEEFRATLRRGAAW